MSVLLAVAVAASVLAYVLAYLTPAGPSPVSFLIVGALVLVTLPTRAIRWGGSAARFVRPIRLFLIFLLIATASVTILSRQVYLLYDAIAERFGFVLGDLLAVLALLFFHGRRHWAIASSLLPACVGLLVLASLNPRTWGFLPLAVVAAMALWAWTILSGGPPRRGLAFVLFAVAGAGLAAATTLFLPWAAPYVVRLVVRSYEEGKTGLSDRSELGEFRRLATSQRRVARVFTREPIGSPVLLRMKVFDQFDGRRWTSGASPTRTLMANGAGTLPPESLLAEVPGSTFDLTEPRDGSSLGPGAVEARVLLSLGFNEGWGLLVPARTSRARLPGESIKVDAFGQVFTPEGLPAMYGAASSGFPADSEQPSRNDLQAPTLEEVAQLATSLGPPAASNAEKLARTIAFLNARPFRYTLDVGAFRSTDPLREFLFEKQAGYCEYFASAAAILLRLQGVPTRFVKGVSVRAENAVAGHYVVRESDAHAWIEAWVPGEGWVEADPTPPGDYAALHPSDSPGPFEETWEALQARVASSWAWLRQEALARAGSTVRKGWEAVVEAVRRRPEMAVVGVLFAAFVLASPRLLRRLRRWLRMRSDRRRAEAARAVVPPGLRAMLGRVEQAWARAGWPRPPARGLREHLRGLPPHVLTPDTRAISEAVVDCYYRTAFGGHSPSAQELAVLARSLE